MCPDIFSEETPCACFLISDHLPLRILGGRLWEIWLYQLLINFFTTHYLLSNIGIVPI